MTKTRAASPYLLEEPPTSTGKVLLSRAFEHWCALHHGYSSEEIVAAFDPAASAPSDVRTSVGTAARLIGELAAAGELRTFARPFGGGSPERLPASDWELDDFRPRLAWSAIDPRAPFASDADPTHWIFVDLDDFNRVVEASCADVRRPQRPEVVRRDREGASPSEGGSMPSGDRHVRMPELERRTGMSRSTIYRRIEAGRFPSQIPLSGNIASWWESEVADWLADPR